jgi:hypothetical protein
VAFVARVVRLLIFFPAAVHSQTAQSCGQLPSVAAAGSVTPVYVADKVSLGLVEDVSVL